MKEKWLKGGLRLVENIGLTINTSDDGFLSNKYFTTIFLESKNTHTFFNFF